MNCLSNLAKYSEYDAVGWHPIFEGGGAGRGGAGRGGAGRGGAGRFINTADVLCTNLR